MEHNAKAEAGKLEAPNAASLAKAESAQALEIERQHWLAIPATRDFLSAISLLRDELLQSAKSAALLGDNDKCARMLVQVSSVESVINKAKNG